MGHGGPVRIGQPAMAGNVRCKAQDPFVVNVVEHQPTISAAACGVQTPLAAAACPISASYPCVARNGAHLTGGTVWFASGFPLGSHHANWYATNKDASAQGPQARFRPSETRTRG